MKNRGTINLIIDLLLLLLMAALSGIGFLMKYILPSGRDKILHSGGNRDLLFWGWDRHEWGELHLILAFVLIALLVLHIVFHWGCVLSMVRCRISHAGLRQGLWLGMVLITLFLLSFPFIFSPVAAEADSFLYRNAQAGTAGPASKGDGRQSMLEGEIEMPRETASEHHGVHEHVEDISGRMSLAEAAERFSLTIDQARDRLGLPVSVDEGESLGRIRRRLGISMDELRERLNKNGR